MRFFGFLSRRNTKPRKPSVELVDACLSGDYAEARKLLDRGADPNTSVVAGGRLRQPLTIAVGLSDARMVGLLLSHGADANCPNDYAGSALALAAGHGDIESARLLVVQGADVNKSDQDGWTPLMFACKGGHHEVVRFLLNRGANVHTLTDDGQTAASIAQRLGNVALLQLLQ